MFVGDRGKRSQGYRENVEVDIGKMFVGDRGKRFQGYRENVEVDIGKMLKWI